jgi:hypothetical protein
MREEEKINRTKKKDFFNVLFFIKFSAENESSATKTCEEKIGEIVEWNF